MTDLQSEGSAGKAEARRSRTIDAWRADPYRLFFPLGLLLAWIGVAHWLLHGLGILADYRSVFHSIVQIQGFMLCFALGFLLTAIPRRTSSAPPSGWLLAMGVAMPLGSVVAAWFEQFGLSQVFWLLLFATLVAFLVRRMRASGGSRRAPDSFVWLPLSLLTGTVGSLLIGAYGILGEEYFELHDLGRGLLLQGMFLGLIIGLGGMIFPLLTRGESSTDSATTGESLRARAGHVAAALALAGTFWVESVVSLRAGLGLRATLLTLLLLFSARLYRPPSVAGAHRRWVWLAGWMLPAGYLLASVFPEQKKAGLHVVFIGGFALLALSVGLHVILAHGGHRELVFGKPWQVPAFGILILGSIVLRGLVDFDPDRFFLWLSSSAAAFLMATLLWAWLALPRLAGAKRPSGPPG